MAESGTTPPCTEAEARTLHIHAGRASVVDGLREFVRHREIVVFLAWRDVKLRYRQTALGVAWAILQPLLSMVILVAVLGRLGHLSGGALPYPVFVYAGLVNWTFLANTVTQGSTALAANPNLLTKVYFPRLALPMASVVSGLVDLAIGHLPLVPLLLLNRQPVPPGAALAIVPVAGVALLAFGLTAFFSALNVRYRDVRYALPFLVQMGLFASPVFYPPTVVPERWRWLFELNPVCGLLEAYRAALGGESIDWRALLRAFAVVALLTAAAIEIFQRMERSFADEV